MKLRNPLFSMALQPPAPPAPAPQAPPAPPARAGPPVPALAPPARRDAFGWNDLEIERAGHYMHRADRYRFSPEEADHIADLLIVRDRSGDDRRTCLECGYLELGGRCHLARLGRLPCADRVTTPDQLELKRCPGFIPGAAPTD